MLAVARLWCIWYVPVSAWFRPLSLHDALPISFTFGVDRVDEGLQAIDLGQVPAAVPRIFDGALERACGAVELEAIVFVFGARDRKSTRLNYSHLVISYAVFCLKKKRRMSMAGV